MDNQKELKGLSGWLILVGIGVVVSPLRLFVTAMQSFTPLFREGTWAALTTAGSEYYHPAWAPLLIGEIVYNLGMVSASAYLIYLFFSRHYLFPNVYIIVVIVSVIFIPIDAWLVTLVMPMKSMFDPDTMAEFARTFISGLIWVPYMLVSKRVKATFVEKKHNDRMPLPATNAE